MALHQDLVHEALNRGTANFLLSASIERTNYCPHSGFKWPILFFRPLWLPSHARDHTMVNVAVTAGHCLPRPCLRMFHTSSQCQVGPWLRARHSRKEHSTVREAEEF